VSYFDPHLGAFSTRIEKILARRSNSSRRLRLGPREIIAVATTSRTGAVVSLLEGGYALLALGRSAA